MARFCCGTLDVPRRGETIKRATVVDGANQIVRIFAFSQSFNSGGNGALGKLPESVQS